MMSRVQTPLFTRNPYLLGFSDMTWGWMYVLHGLSGIALVGLIMAHIYFAVRPEKLFITKSMIFGWMSREKYLEHYDPQRWVIDKRSARARGAGSDRSPGFPPRWARISAPAATPSKSATSSCWRMPARDWVATKAATRAAQVRDYLERAADAILGLADAYAAIVKRESSNRAGHYSAFLGVLQRDAQDSLAAIQLVLAQNTISSQLIDNLNASIHLRALLTDLFLIDEILKPQPTREKPATAE